MFIRSFALAAAVALPAQAALAGGMAPPNPGPVVVVEPAPSALADLFIPLAFLALIVIASSAKRDDGDPIGISDSRLKTDIALVGTSPSGLPIYQWRYLGQDQRLQGTMAQDLLSLRPEAVTSDWLGFCRVNYDLIDVAMTRVN